MLSNNSLRTLIALALALLIAAAPAAAQDQEKAPWFEEVSVNTFLSTAYIYNFNRPDTHKNSYRVFDFDDGQFKVDVLELVLQKPVREAGDVGFRADLTAGSSVPRVSRSSGLDAGDLDVQQAFLSFIAPVGNGLRFDVGKFVTLAGYELIEGFDGYNDNYSRSFLFGYAIPFTHTGISATYGCGDNCSATLMLVNGWDNAVDNNTAKSIGGQIKVSPVTGMVLLANGLYGAEKPGNDSDQRSLFDFVGSYAINDNITIGVNGDYGSEEGSAPDGGDATWWGAAAYVRLNLSQEFSLSLRGEQFEDTDGIRTGVDQQLREATITPEYRPFEHLVVRGDVRFDMSDNDVFQEESNWTDTQTTFGLNIICVF